MKKILSLFPILLCLFCFGQESKGQIDSSNVAINYDVKFIKKNLIGKWKDQNSTIIFKKHGRYINIYDNKKTKEYGSWEIRLNRLVFFVEGFPIGTSYDILYISPTTMKTRLSNCTKDTIWIANKILEPQK